MTTLRGTMTDEQLVVEIGRLLGESAEGLQPWLRVPR